MEDSHLNLSRASFEQAAQQAGSWSALATICGCTPGNLSQLKKKRSPLPAQYVLKVEAATGISRHDLRPDLYPIDAIALPTPRAGQSVGPQDEEVACDRHDLSQPVATEPSR
nr:YdaS family helix-turn-helix protein [Sphingomonas bacterium]